MTIDIPVPFTQEAKQVKDSDMELNRWRTPDNRIVEVIYFPDTPKYDRGPMVKANEEEIMVGGQKTKLIETKIFFGQEKKALVVYLRTGASIHIVVSENIPREDFKRLLQSVSFKKKETVGNQNSVSRRESQKPPLLTELASKYPLAVKQISAQLKKEGDEPAEFHATVEEKTDGKILVFSLIHKDTYVIREKKNVRGNPSGKDRSISYDVQTGVASRSLFYQ